MIYYDVAIGNQLGLDLPTTIIVNRLEYWFSKMKREFYKYTSACESSRDGDSWSEELGLSAYVFNKSFKNIGKIYKTLTEYESTPPEQRFKDEDKEYLYLSVYCRRTNKTYYHRNDALCNLVFQKIKEGINFVLTKIKDIRKYLLSFCVTETSPAIQPLETNNPFETKKTEALEAEILPELSKEDISDRKLDESILSQETEASPCLFNIIKAFTPSENTQDIQDEKEITPVVPHNEKQETFPSESEEFFLDAQEERSFYEFLRERQLKSNPKNTFDKASFFANNDLFVLKKQKKNNKRYHHVIDLYHAWKKDVKHVLEESFEGYQKKKEEEKHDEFQSICENEGFFAAMEKVHFS